MSVVNFECRTSYIIIAFRIGYLRAIVAALPTKRRIDPFYENEQRYKKLKAVISTDKGVAVINRPPALDLESLCTLGSGPVVRRSVPEAERSPEMRERPRPWS